MKGSYTSRHRRPVASNGSTSSRSYKSTSSVPLATSSTRTRYDGPSSRGRKQNSLPSTPSHPPSSRPLSLGDEAGDPVDTFVEAIDRLPAEHWEARCAAVTDLVSTLPTEGHRGALPSWITDKKKCAVLVSPFCSVLGDLRSGLVRVACDGLSTIAEKASSIEGTGPTMRQFFKDLLPDLILLHGQTVKTIQSYAMSAVLCIIQNLRFKAGLLIICNSIVLKDKKKLKDVKVACVRYLREILICWTPEYLAKVVQTLGKAIHQGLLDAVQAVRMEAKETYSAFFQIFPEEARKLIELISNNHRLTRSLENICTEADRQKRKEIRHGASIVQEPARIHVLERSSVPLTNGRIPDRHTLGLPHSSFPPNNPFSSLETPKKPFSTLGGSIGSVSQGASSTGSSLENSLGPYAGLDDVSLEGVAEKPELDVPLPRRRYTKRKSTIEVRTEIEENLKVAAAVSIQAAVRGVVARKSIETAAPSTPGLRTKKKFGATAAAMANRRRSSVCLSSLDTAIAGGYVSLLSPEPKPAKKNGSSKDSGGAQAMSTNDLASIHELNQDDVISSPLPTEPRMSDPTPRISNRVAGGTVRQSPRKSPRSTQPSMGRVPCVPTILAGIEAINAHKLNIDEIMETLREEMVLIEEYETRLQTASREKILEYIDTVGVCLDQRNDINQKLRGILREKQKDLML